MSATVVSKRLAARPEGASNAEVQEASGYGAEHVSGCLGKLTARSELVAVKAPGHAQRWFADAAHAAAWMANLPAFVRLEPGPRKRKPKPPKPQKMPKPEPKPKSQPKVRRSAAAGVHIESSVPQGQVIVPVGLVVSKGLSSGFDSRYQCGPGEKPWGAGFVAAGAGFDVITGKPWARQAK